MPNQVQGLPEGAVEAFMEALIEDRGEELGAVDSDEASRWLKAALPTIEAAVEERVREWLEAALREQAEEYRSEAPEVGRDRERRLAAARRIIFDG